jgi:hypothetical protein
MTDPRWENLRPGASHSEWVPGDPDYGLAEGQAASIADDILASPKRPEDEYLPPCGDPSVDPTEGKSWRGR